MVFREMDRDGFRNAIGYWLLIFFLVCLPVFGVIASGGCNTRQGAAQPGGLVQTCFAHASISGRRCSIKSVRS